MVLKSLYLFKYKNFGREAEAVHSAKSQKCWLFTIPGRQGHSITVRLTSPLLWES